MRLVYGIIIFIMKKWDHWSGGGRGWANVFSRSPPLIIREKEKHCVPF